MRTSPKTCVGSVFTALALIAGGVLPAMAANINATWSDELILLPGDARLDGTTWRACNVDRWEGFCEANGDLAAPIDLGGTGTNSTWVMDQSESGNGGITNWDGDISPDPNNHVGPLVGYEDMTAQFRFRLTDWEPDNSMDGTPQAGLFIDNNVWEISQEHFHTVRWNMSFGYERRPNNDFRFGPEFGKSTNLSYLALDLADQDPIAGGGHNNIKFADFPLVSDEYVVVRVVVDQTPTTATLTLYAGPTENALVQLGNEISYERGIGPDKYPDYAVDGGWKITKGGTWAGVEWDYFRVYRGVLATGDTLSPTVDFNNDGNVDGADVAVVYNAWGSLTSANLADVTGDGNVDGADLAQVFNNWGATDPAGVPEPASFGALSLGFASLLLARRR